MGAPVMNRTDADVESAREQLLRFVAEHDGSVDLGQAIDHLRGTPVHLLSRAVTDLLGENRLVLTAQQYLAIPSAG